MTSPNGEEPKLYTDAEFRSYLAGEIQRAIDGGRPYAVIAVMPRHLPGEAGDGVVSLAAECVRRNVRADDIVGRLNNDAILVGVKQVDPTEASVLADRIQGELEMRAYQLGHTVWDIGIARLVEHGTTVSRLIGAATKLAHERRVNLAASSQPHVPPPSLEPFD